MSNSASGFMSGGDIRFYGSMHHALDTRAGGPSETLVWKALTAVDPRTLSAGERDTLQTLTRELARDGDIDPADAGRITDLIDSFSHNGIDAFNGASPSFLQDLQRFPGSLLFGGLLGHLVDALVQRGQDQAFTTTSNALIDRTGGGFVQNAVRQAFNAVDLSKLSISDRSALLSLLAVSARDGHLGLAEGRALLKQLGRFEGKGHDYAKALAPRTPTFAAKNNGDGTAHIEINDRYALDLDERNSQLVLTNQQTGEKTTIWGDPHFVAADGKQNMDFKGTVTLNLDDGTKITINTKPYGAGNGATLSSELVITQGKDALVVEGLDQNTLGDLSITEHRGSGAQADALAPDGLELYENPNGAGWMVKDGFFMRAVTQGDLDTTQPGSIAGSYSATAAVVTGALLGHRFAATTELMLGLGAFAAVADTASPDRRELPR